MIKKYILTDYLHFIRESKIYDDFFIVYNEDRYVYHITSFKAASEIMKSGFKTGKELDIAEKRNAIYFSDKDVNYGLYARNQEGETYEGETIGEIKINIKGLKLLNLTYKKAGVFANYQKYNTDVVKGNWL